MSSKKELKLQVVELDVGKVIFYLDIAEIVAISGLSF